MDLTPFKGSIRLLQRYLINYDKNKALEEMVYHFSNILKWMQNKILVMNPLADFGKIYK
jgi:hypothetical protein